MSFFTQYLLMVIPKGNIIFMETQKPILPIKLYAHIESKNTLGRIAATRQWIRWQLYLQQVWGEEWFIDPKIGSVKLALILESSFGLSPKKRSSTEKGSEHSVNSNGPSENFDYPTQWGVGNFRPASRYVFWIAGLIVGSGTKGSTWIKTMP